MFDNPMFIAPPPAAPRHRVFALAVGLTIAVLALLAAPLQSAVVISAPTHLRQVMVISAAGAETDFYLSNAGFRSRRVRRLLASAYGGGSWSVVWAGPDAVQVHLGPGWSRVVAPGNSGIRVEFVTGAA